MPITSDRVARSRFLDTSDQYLCNEVLIDSSRSHFHSEIQHPASKKKYENYTLVLKTSDRVARLLIIIAH